MSKRNNQKKGKQEITQNELHVMAKEWCVGNEDGRAMVLLSLSENGEVSANILGHRRDLDELLSAKSISALLRVYREPPLWKRALAWFFPFEVKK